MVSSKLTQHELSKIMEQYNKTDRRKIKDNFKRIKKELKIQVIDIVTLGFTKSNVMAWGNNALPNIPMFEQALKIATHFDFDVRQFIW